MFEQIDAIADGIAASEARARLATFVAKYPQYDLSEDFAEAYCFPNSILRPHLRNKKEIPDSGEKESGRSLAWVLRWQERKANRKARKLSRRAEGKIGKADRIVSYEKQKIHNPESELRFIEDADRAYNAQLNFMRIISGIQCVPDTMKITDEEV